MQSLLSARIAESKRAFFLFVCFPSFYWLKAALVSGTDTVMAFSLPTFPAFTISCLVLPPFLYLMLCCCFLSFFVSCSIFLFQFFPHFLLYCTEAQTSFQKAVRQQMPHGTAESHMTLVLSEYWPSLRLCVNELLLQRPILKAPAGTKKE